MTDTAPSSEPQGSQPPATPLAPASYPSSGHPGYPGGYGQRARTSQLAIWSLVAALIGLLPALFIGARPYPYLNYHSYSNWRLVGLGVICAVAGIVLGVIALNQIKRTPRGGHGLAAAGIAVGGFVLGIVLFAFRLTF